MKRHVISIVTFSLLTLGLLAGCEESDQAVNAPPPAAKKAVAPKAAAVVENTEVKEQVYVYNGEGTRDPFKSPLDILVEVSDAGVPLTPLQKFDLNQLRLIGVIIGKGDPRAMVIAPDGKSFILKKGVKVGKNNGVVTKVTTDSVEVLEEYMDFTGDIKTSVEEIKLPQRGGSK
ncbi:pilus assembly protein PilP [Malonomonas rubra]|uniref:pilus assembly protein PilP n=1 Tax=Malonomonas rubra TaxID=57040 RepID=UPI0026F1337A|nr:pilus assembly protein PilP [Malonomonas rubra]